MADFPFDIWSEIIMYLPIQDVISLITTSKQFHSSSAIWSRLNNRDFGIFYGQTHKDYEISFKRKQFMKLAWSDIRFPGHAGNYGIGDKVFNFTNPFNTAEKFATSCITIKDFLKYLETYKGRGYQPWMEKADMCVQLDTGTVEYHMYI